MFLSNARADARHAFRLFLRRPLLTTVLLLSLALGIGANGAIYTIAHATLFEQPDYSEPEQLVNLWETYPSDSGGGWGTLSIPNLLDWRAQSKTLSAMSAYRLDSFNLLPDSGSTAERLSGLSAEPDLLQLLGVAPAKGRLFDRDETGVVVISNEFWSNRLGSSAEVVGSELRLNEKVFEVVGVMPEGFSFPEGRSVAFYLPIQFTSSELANRGSHWARVVGRLDVGSSKEDATAELATIAAAIAAEYPDLQEGRGAKVESLREPLVRDSKSILLMLLCAVGLVLLITCANVTNLLLAQASQRRQELTIRAALGAGRAQLARQMMMETGLLAGFGGLLGALMGSLALRQLSSFRGVPFRVSEDLAVDYRVLSFSVGAALVSALLCGLLPAMRWSRPGAGGGSLSARGTHRDGVRSTLVVAEIALAVVVLVAAGLMVRSLVNLTSVDSGLEGDRLMKFSLVLGSERYEDPEALNAYWQRVTADLGALSSVESAGLVNLMPLVEWGMNGDFQVVGRPPADATTAPFAEQRAASPGYFATAGIPLLRGEIFPDNLSPDGAAQIVVNRALEERYFPDGEALGQMITTSNDLADQESWATIVGVVGNVRAAGLARDHLPTIYYSTGQWLNTGLNVVLSSRADLATVMEEVRPALSLIDPNQAPFAVSSFDGLVKGSTGRQRFSANLLASFGLLSLFLSLGGVAGVLWYTTSLRKKEVAIRLAVGAQKQDIVRSFMTDSVLEVLLGVGLGLGSAALLVRFLKSQLFGVSELDPVTYAAVAVGILISAGVAALVPAWRATKAQPGTLLRD